MTATPLIDLPGATSRNTDPGGAPATPAGWPGRPLRHAVDSLEPEARSLYTHLLDRPGPAKAAEVAERVGLRGEVLGAAVVRLLELGLLDPLAHRSDLLVAVPPDTARRHVMAPALRRLDMLHQEIERLRQTYSEAGAVYRHSLRGAECAAGLEPLYGEDAVRTAIDDLLATGVGEVLSSHPGGAQSGEPARLSPVRVDGPLPGVPVQRMLFQHTARFHPETVELVARASLGGAQVRSCGDDFMRLVVCDHKAAVIELDDATDGALLVRDPSVVAFLRGAFERAWVRASRFGPEYDHHAVGAVTEEVKQAIVRLLVEGVEDKVIARRMGMSLRTCQRHVSEIMRRLGARNRLHVGYLIAREELRRGGVPQEARDTRGHGTPGDATPAPGAGRG